MNVGAKIKEFRTKEKMTQKELAEALNVTYQAVSRWENNTAEPSIDTVKEMCKIFHCSTDELFGVEPEVVEKEEQPEPQPSAQQIVVLGVCHDCNKPIVDGSDLKRVKEKQHVMNGRAHTYIEQELVVCADCQAKRIEKRKKEEAAKKAALKHSLAVRRAHSFIWPLLIAAILIGFGIREFVIGETTIGWGLLGGAVIGFTLPATAILYNTFIPELWGDIASWGFIKLPGIIFEFSLDGFVFLIVIKILFWILGFLAALAAVVLATAIAGVLSIFVYPFALSRNLRGIVND